MVYDTKQLEHGCIKVLATAHGKSKLFKGYYDKEKQRLVTFNIPHFYTVKGYIQ